MPSSSKQFTVFSPHIPITASVHLYQSNTKHSLCHHASSLPINHIITRIHDAIRVATLETEISGKSPKTSLVMDFYVRLFPFRTFIYALLFVGFIDLSGVGRPSNPRCTAKIANVPKYLTLFIIGISINY